MCNHETLFSCYQALKTPLNVVLGDGQSLRAIRNGGGELEMKLYNGKTKSCTLHYVLLVPDLAYLFSVTSVSKRGKVTTFSKLKWEIRDTKSNLLAVGYKEGSLYYLDYADEVHQAYPSSDHTGCKTLASQIWPPGDSRNGRIGKK